MPIQKSVSPAVLVSNSKLVSVPDNNTELPVPVRSNTMFPALYVLNVKSLLSNVSPDEIYIGPFDLIFPDTSFVKLMS